MPKVLFVYDHEYPDLWRDGLWAALKILEKDFEIQYWNPRFDGPQYSPFSPDFILGWGGFGSDVDHFIQTLNIEYSFDYGRIPCGLCIGGNAIPWEKQNYDILFYETEWYKPQINTHPRIMHAFGINDDIYYPYRLSHRLWDFITVGSFAKWKRQTLLLNKPGNKLAIGQVQKGNLEESMGIIGELLGSGVAISDMVSPDKLALIYNLAKKVYIPADINGGGERAVLEARSCNIPVEIEPDNDKLKELLTSPIWNQNYYAEQLKKGISLCLH